MLRIGVDVGGTFTDFVAFNSDKDEFISYKTPSTPPDYIEGFITGIENVLSRLGAGEGDDVLIMHGTTVSTNTVIERSGAKLALFVTRGFRDILELQRFRLDDPIRIDAGRTEPLIPRNLIFEIDERLEPDGFVLQPLDPDRVRALAGEAVAQGAQGIVVVFLHSYRDPVHERMAADAIADAFPDLPVSLSSEILPRIGEYERAVSAVLNAYVKDRMGGYLSKVETYLAERSPKARLFITRSNGGAMSSALARHAPVHTLLSGPASGVTAARFLGRRLADPRLLTFDMGGTSTDIALIEGDRPTITTDAEVGDFPLNMPVTGVEAIGAGGGSVAWLDNRLLRVGPRSAGAMPGPACFGRGGTEPTVTDAYLLSGLIDAGNFLGGRMRLDAGSARAAYEPLARALGLDVEAAAEACLSIATSNMIARTLPYLARHGVDPEDLTLVLFGGAGSLHGPMLAYELGIGRILIPHTPSVFCAYGGLVSDLVQDEVMTVYGTDPAGPDLARLYDRLEGRARAWLSQQIDPGFLTGTHIEHWAEMRYRGQSFSLNIFLPAEIVRNGDLAAIHEVFHAEYERLYSHADRASAIELLELRVRLAGSLLSPRAQALPPPSGGAPPSRRDIRFNGTAHAGVEVRQRDSIGPGTRLAGPAIVEQNDTTIFVPPGFDAHVRETGDIVMERT